MKASIIILIFVSFVDTVQCGISRNFIEKPRPSLQETPRQGASREHPALLELLIRPASTDQCPPLVSCRMECPEGFLKDEQDCEICRCKSAANGNEGSGSVNEDSASENEDSAGKNEGSGSKNEDSASDDEDSANPIENSTGKNEDSASKNEDSANENKDHTNDRVSCIDEDTYKQDCPDGFVLDCLCLSCYCRPDPATLRAEREASRLKVDCSQRPACRLRCPYGYRIDSDGCNTCSCVYYKFPRMFHMPMPMFGH